MILTAYSVRIIIRFTDAEMEMMCVICVSPSEQLLLMEICDVKQLIHCTVCRQIELYYSLYQQLHLQNNFLLWVDSWLHVTARCKTSDVTISDFRLRILHLQPHIKTCCLQKKKTKE